MLLLLLLVGFGNTEKSVLIIGGDESGTIEQFFPSNQTSRVIATIKFPDEQEQTNTSSEGARFDTLVQVTPVNSTHVFLLRPTKRNTFFMNQTGHLTPGPFVERRLSGPGVTSIPSDNGQMVPIFCGGNDEDHSGDQLNNCYVLSADYRILPHKPMLVGREFFSLTAFGNQLVAIDGEAEENSKDRYSERFNGSEWVKCQIPPHRRFNSVAVKLNETSLLSCGLREHRERCLIYHVNIDSWVDLEIYMKQRFRSLAMTLIGQKIYAFGADHHGVETEKLSKHWT